MFQKSTVLIFLLACFVRGLAQPNDSLRHSVSITHEQNHFNGQFSQPWYGASLQYATRLQAHVVGVRVNYANRFGRGGMQYEAEAYPQIGNNWYGWIGAAYSGDVPVFSRWRTGSSIYAPIAKGWELEGGLRMLQFDENIWMGVAGLSAYAGAWLFNLRSFISANQPTQNASFFITARNYFQAEKSYWWLQAGRGISPDETRGVQFNETSRLVSNRLTGGMKLSLSSNWRWQLMAGWSADEYGVSKSGTQLYGHTGFEWLLR